jgi:cytidylate kinase
MPIITIYEGIFRGGDLVAKKTAETLGYLCVGREMLVEAAQRYGIAEAKLDEILRKEPHWWERWLENLRPYKAVLQAAMCELAQGKNLVYHGHIAHELFSSLPQVLRVLLTAPIEYRIQEVQKLEGLDEAEASRYIHHVDKARSRRLMALFGADWQDPSRYSLALNMAQMSLEGASRLIIEASRLEDYRPTPAFQQAFQDLTVTARVEAALLMAPGFRNLALGVRADNGQVQVSGVIPQWISEREIVRLIKDIPGVFKVVTGLTRVELDQVQAR